MPSRRALRSLVLLLVATACGTRPSATSRPGPPGAAAPTDPMAAPWVLALSEAPRTQQLVLAARLITETDTLVREDSVESALTVEWAPERGAGTTRWSGQVIDFRVRAGTADSASMPAGVEFPVRFSAAAGQAGAQPIITSADHAECASAEDAVVQGWRELWVAPPTALHPGTAWQDSSTYTLCRDGIPLRVQSVRSYVAESALMRDNGAHVLVVRRSRVMLEGSGVQFGDTVRIIGGGSSTVRLLIPLDGSAMTGQGGGVLTLELRGRRRTQRLTQESSLEIRAP